MEWLQKGTHEKHLSVYEYEKKMRKAEVEELEQEISSQKDIIADQSLILETNETALQSQQQILEENEERVKKIRQETEQAKEDWEKVQIDKDKAQDSYKYYKTLKNRCGIQRKENLIKQEEVQTEADFVKEQAMQQYEKYRRVEPSERGTAMFDEMLRLKRENMILEDENKTLKKKLQKAYDFMKRFTINGLNMLESFFAIYWGKNA